MKLLQPLTALAFLAGLVSVVPAEPPKAPAALPAKEDHRQIIIQALLVRMDLRDDMLVGNPAGLNVGVIKGDPSEQIRPFNPDVLSRPQIRTLDGQSAMIAIGSVISIPTPDEPQAKNNPLDVGTKFEILPRILKEEKVWMRFKWEQTKPAEISQKEKGKDSAKGSGNEALVMGFINEGVATASPGETIVISHPDPQASEKDGKRPQLFIFLTPRILEVTADSASQAAQTGWDVKTVKPKSYLSTLDSEPKPPEPVKRRILLKAQVCRLPLTRLMEIHGGTMPPELLVLNHNPQMFKQAVLELKGSILAEPTLVTADGRPATLVSGGEIPVLAPGETPSKIDFLPFGTKLEFLPRVQPEGKIWMRFRLEQTRRSKAEEGATSAADSEATTLTSGVVSEGVATVEPGESLFARIPLGPSPSPYPVGDVLVMVFTPEIMNEDAADAAVTPGPPAPLAPGDSLPVLEIATHNTPTARLKGDARADLYLEVGGTGVFESSERLRRVSLTEGRASVARIIAHENGELTVQAKQVGSMNLLATDINGREYHAFIDVKPAKGSSAVQDTLSQLFPSADLNVISINDSLLLRGSVTKEDHIKQITEIAEQFAPKVLNHLIVQAAAVPANPTGKQANPLAVMMGGSRKIESVQAQEPSEVQQLRQDVKSLHQDVKRLIELLERKAASKPQVKRSPLPAPQVPDYAPPSAGVPYAPTPRDESAKRTPQSDAEPYWIPRPPRITLPNPAAPYTPTPPSVPSAIVPRYGVEPPRPVEPLPNHTGRNPVQPLPKHSGANPIKPVPRPAGEFFEPTFPSPVAKNGEEAKPLETSALPADLDPTAFVRVRVAKISSPNDSDVQPIDEALGSGVVIESEPGKAVVLTAAHLLRNYQPGKSVLQVATADGPRPATIIMQDDNANVALLRAKIPNKVGTVSLARHSLPEKGEAVGCVGYQTAVHQKPVIVNAFVSHTNRYQEPENFEFGGLIPQGFSGAAVLDAKSQLIGIATAVDKENKQTVCSPAAEIRKLLAISE